MIVNVRDAAVSAVWKFLRAAARRVTHLRNQISLRIALARQPWPEGVSAPRARLLLPELRALFSLGRKPDRIENARRPGPVMLLPGFAAHPARMKPMYRALEEAGHRVQEWGLGFNLGPTEKNFGFLMRRVEALARSSGRPVALVGWSLGGLFAREIAWRQPDNVSRVITMGTPFSGDPRANNAWRAYQVITGHSVDEPPIECARSGKPPVPTIALWSPCDGVVHPRSASGWPGERDRAVAVRSTHLGFANDPRVIVEVLRQLDRED